MLSDNFFGIYLRNTLLQVEKSGRLEHQSSVFLVNVTALVQYLCHETDHRDIRRRKFNNGLGYNNRAKV